MSRKRIDAALDSIVETRGEVETLLWQKATEASSILAEVDRRKRKPLLKHVRKEMYLEQGRCCAICGQHLPEGDIHEDHLVPISYGGGNERSNLRLVHASCNLERGNDPYEAVTVYDLIQYIEDRVNNLPTAERLALLNGD